MTRALLIGFGAIGRWLFETNRNSTVTISCVVVRSHRLSETRQILNGAAQVVSDIRDVQEQPDFAIECAGHDAVKTHGPAILQHGIDLALVSAGALADRDLSKKLLRSAAEGGARITVLSGAVGAIDASAAARRKGLKRVVYVGRKPPGAWAGSRAEEVIDLAGVNKPTEHFRGAAGEAALLYPRNSNVAATVALAGLGLDRTETVLIADPGIKRNIHEIKADGEFGTMRFSIEGQSLKENPRTSGLAAMSAQRFLEDRQALLII